MVCLERSVPAEQIRRLDLCLNEALANIITHGGPAARSSPVQLVFRVRHHADINEVALTVSDSGAAFDPLTHQSSPRPQTLAEAEPGGLGLIMMRNFSDALSYHYSEGRNQLTFIVRWTKAEA
jgi:anti-sigma regulatory factor (Ser/Thr protein kinase)